MSAHWPHDDGLFSLIERKANEFYFTLQEELVERLGKKLKVLETEQTMLAEESSVNDTLGHEVAFKVAQKLKPADSTKFRSFVDDVGYITMLLLSLSGRLARIENALHTIGEKSADKVSWSRDGNWHLKIKNQTLNFFIF